jgi:hypothetical protein
VAQIGEQRLLGPPRPIAASRSETVLEHEAAVDAAGGPARCRDLVVTSPLVRDVTVRRYFVGEGQTINLALSALAGAAIALMAFGAHQAACSDGGICHDVARVHGPIVGVSGLALVPLALAGYNAIRVQDGRETEFALPELVAGPWAPCPADAALPASGPSAAR